MQINLTLLIQALNVLITIWMLRRIFWPELLTALATEDHVAAHTIQSCEEVRLELQTISQAQHEKEASLARSINAAFKPLEEVDAAPALVIEKTFLKAPAEIEENVTHKATADKFASLLQQKF